MSTSGIGPSSELSDTFSSAVDSGSVRFLKVSIYNESLVPDGSTPPSGSFEEDLLLLKDILEDSTPAYVLARLDNPSSKWLAIFYVPETAKVRDKMLYASTRNSVTKSLGSASFTDSIFATSKADLTPEAYVRHKLSLAAPKPLSPREQELADLAAAEKKSAGSAYQGSAALLNHHRTAVGLKWSEELEDALKELGSDNSSRLLVVSIDPPSETLMLSESIDCSADTLGSSLPSSEPSFALFAWSHTFNSSPRREIVFIYCCPSASPVKHRMLYSSCCLSVFRAANALLASTGGDGLADRKLETSEPRELNEAFLKAGLRLDISDNATSTTISSQQAKPFARPKGPGRRR